MLLFSFESPPFLTAFLAVFAVSYCPISNPPPFAIVPFAIAAACRRSASNRHRFSLFRFEPNLREALYRYCSERGVPHRRCGKLIVASSDLQLPALRDLHKRAEACGVGDVRLVGAEEAREMESEVLCTEVTVVERLTLFLLHSNPKIHLSLSLSASVLPQQRECSPKDAKKGLKCADYVVLGCRESRAGGQQVFETVFVCLFGRANASFGLNILYTIYQVQAVVSVYHRGWSVKGYIAVFYYSIF